VLGLALEQASVMREDDRAHALARLAGHLPEHLLLQAPGTAGGIRDINYRSQALDALVPRTPTSLLPAALRAARAILDEATRRETVEVLRSVVDLSESPNPGASQPQLPQWWDRYLNGVRPEDLPAVSPAISFDEMLRSGATLYRASLGHVRWQTWIGLFGSLAGGDDPYSALALARLAPHLPQVWLGDAVDSALTHRLSVLREGLWAGSSPDCSNSRRRFGTIGWTARCAPPPVMDASACATPLRQRRRWPLASVGGRSSLRLLKRSRRSEDAGHERENERQARQTLGTGGVLGKGLSSTSISSWPRPIWR
jgi:hypothetical protein